MSKVFIWEKDQRKMYINEDNLVIGSIGKQEEFKKVNTKNGWVKVNEYLPVSTEYIFQNENLFAKAKYESMIKAGLSIEDASNLSGYTEE